MLSLFWGFISTMWYVKNLDILSHILVATCFISTMWYVKLFEYEYKHRKLNSFISTMWYVKFLLH